MPTITLRGGPGDTPCSECDGEGEVWIETGGSDPDVWVAGVGEYRACAWCHGTGRELRPIPVEDLHALLGRRP